MPLYQRLLMVLATTILISCGIVDEPKNEQLHWEKLPIQYHISAALNESEQQQIHQAFDEWEQAVQTNLFKFGGVVDLDDQHIGNNYHPLKNVIFKTNQSGKLPDDFDDGIDALARTFVRGATKIRDTDVVFYNFTDNYISGTKSAGDIYSIRTVMLHEIGRMLFGDRNGSDSYSVLNNPVYPKNHAEEKISVSQGDIDLFFEVYAPLI